MSHHHDVETLRPHVAAASKHIAIALLGEPSGQFRHQLRFGDSFGVSVEIDGHKMGQWFDHTTGEGGDMFKLIQRECRCDFKEALNKAAAFINRHPNAIQRRVRPSAPEIDLAEIKRKKAVASHLWGLAVAFEGSPAETYLRGRCIEPPPRIGEALRYLPKASIKLLDGTLREGPAMIAANRDIGTDELIGVHLTGITADGERVKDANGKTLRRIRGFKKNGAIKLTPRDAITGTLCVGEGIESVLSLMELTSEPGWSVIDAGELVKFPPMDAIERLIIGEDNDAKGTGAARDLASRWREFGRVVERLRPSIEGGDFNDVLCGVKG
jgi:hypothetical protein